MASGGKPADPWIRFCRSASALIRLSSTASLAAEEALFDAARQHRLEQMAQKFALAEAAITVFENVASLDPAFRNRADRTSSTRGSNELPRTQPISVHNNK